MSENRAVELRTIEILWTRGQKKMIQIMGTTEA